MLSPCLQNTQTSRHPTPSVNCGVNPPSKIRRYFLSYILSTRSRDSDLLNFDDYKDYWRDLTLGNYIDEELPVFQLRILGKGVPPDILQFGVLTVVSLKFVSILKELHAEHCVQLFPVDVYLKQGKWEEQHYVMTVTNKLDCIDLEKSKYEVIADLYKDICPLVLDETKITENDCVFVLSSAIYSSIFMNDRAKEYFKKAKLKKVSFYEIDEWNSSILNPHN